MKQSIGSFYFVALIMFIACNPATRITGSKPNGSNYILSINKSNQENDSVLVNGTVRTTGTSIKPDYPKGVNVADSSGKRLRTVMTDNNGNFSCIIAPGKYKFGFGDIGFGWMQTKTFDVKA